MRIDLHCHTKNCKKGDGKKRNVTKEKFIETISGADVGIVAITNHNCFDLDQFNEFINDKFMIWPGIELDVFGEVSRGHCIVIGNPDHLEDFNETMKQIINGVHPDQFEIDILELAQKIKCLDVVVICHYGQKSPSLDQIDIDRFKAELGDAIPFYCEPRNLLSAGIYYANNINTMIGSDVKNWDNYSTDRVPELKIPIDSFNKFKLLIKKDPQTIKTFVNKKESQILDLTPFENKNEHLSLKIYDDINILFGGKGTGKTKILEELENKLSSKFPNEVSHYYASGKAQTFENLIDRELNDSDFNKLNVDDCARELKFFSEWKDINISTLKDYYNWWTTTKEKDIKFGFVNASFIDRISINEYNQKKDEYNNIKKAVNTIENIDISQYLSQDECKTLNMLLEKLTNSMYLNAKHEYCMQKSLYLEKFTIDKMKTLYRNKKGTYAKPSSAGLLSVYNHNKNVEKNSHKILNSLKVKSAFDNAFIGEISDGHYIFARREIFLDTNKHETNCKKITPITKCKKFKSMIDDINKKCFSLDLNDSINEFVNFNKENNITSLRKLIFMKISTVKTDSMIFQNDSDNYEEYTPSSGEQAMLIISNAIEVKKKVYILDEPEMSVGHDYINNKILPRLKELSRNNCYVIIATHDANIAVRSLPLSSVYREKCGDCVLTYVGNPFIDNMVNVADDTDVHSWAELSLNTLEGGKIAFNERGETYGQDL